MRRWIFLLLSVVLAVACKGAVDVEADTSEHDCAAGAEVWLVAPHSSLRWRFAHRDPSILLASDIPLFDERATLTGVEKSEGETTFVPPRAQLVPGRTYNVAVSGDAGVFDPDVGTHVGQVHNPGRLCLVVSGIRIDSQLELAGSSPTRIQIRGVVRNRADRVELRLDTPDGPLVATTRARRDHDDDDCDDEDERHFVAVATTGHGKGAVRVFAIADGESDFVVPDRADRCTKITDAASIISERDAIRFARALESLR